MITYKTNDLIKKAINLCDLKNNSFMTNEMSIQLLNDSYIQCYQKLIDIKHDEFLISVDINNGDELPENLYQIAEVYYVYKDNPFKKYSLVKNRDFMLKNGKIYFKDNYNNYKYCLDYYPIPDKLTLNESGTDSHTFEVNFPDVAFADCQFAQLGKWLFVVNGSNIYRIEYGKTKFKKYDISGVTDIFVTNDMACFNTSDKAYIFYKDGDYTEESTAYGYNTYNATSYGFSYTANVTRRIIIDGENYDFDTAYESIKWNDGTFIATYDVNMDIITDTTESKHFYQPCFISKVTDKKNFIYGEAWSTSNRLITYNFTQVFTPEEGTSILTVPNNAFYSLLAYDLAIAIKTIAGEDISALTVLRDNAAMTFADTMKQDITPYVIEDVYDTGKNWWF